MIPNKEKSIYFNMSFTGGSWTHIQGAQSHSDSEEKQQIMVFYREVWCQQLPPGVGWVDSSGRIIKNVNRKQTRVHPGGLERSLPIGLSNKIGLGRLNFKKNPHFREGLASLGKEIF